MLTLGDLERSVMDVLWSAPAPLTAYELIDRLPAGAGGTAGDEAKRPAATTMLTVLSRLENKGFVSRERATRPHAYSAVGTREDHMALLMRQVLGSVENPAAVLERFVGQVSPAEAETLRKLLG